MGLLRQSVLWAAALSVACSLVFMGGLIWIDNTWAVVGDNDPATSIEISIMFAALGGDLADLDPDGDGQIPLTGGKLLKGNGGHDDNKPEPPVMAAVAVVLVKPLWFSAPPILRGHPTVKSYLDFGHLKIFPGAAVSYIWGKINLGKKAAALCSRGGLYCWGECRVLAERTPEGGDQNLNYGVCLMMLSEQVNR